MNTGTEDAYKEWQTDTCYNAQKKENNQHYIASHIYIAAKQ